MTAPAVDSRDVRLGARLVWAAVAAFLVAVPFLFLLLAVLGTWDGLARIDDGAADALHAVVVDRPGAVRALKVLEVASQPWNLRVATAVICLVLWRRGRTRLAVWLGVTMAAGGVLGGTIKLLVARARPALDDPVSHAGGYSFPSGHALNSFLFVGCLMVAAHPVLRGGRRAAAWVTAVVVVVVVGLDRVALGVHFVSDVVAGWVVAMALLCATVAGFQLWRRQEGLAPATASEGLAPEQRPDADQQHGDRVLGRSVGASVPARQEPTRP
ncbi:MAG: phosphatase PAP2 family protein [Kineosporiaceae bacterium]